MERKRETDAAVLENDLTIASIDSTNSKILRTPTLPYPFLF
jgi:hypothetical protein